MILLTVQIRHQTGNWGSDRDNLAGRLALAAIERYKLWIKSRPITTAKEDDALVTPVLVRAVLVLGQLLVHGQENLTIDKASQ